ncbi:MAG TPA: primosomal protein N' [Ktedonobacterales bacterium]|nr:primosomal protein N' [Ktedonobacterales bacterium]
MLAEVLVPDGAWGRRNRRALFTYRVPPALAASVQPGHLVAVPFGSRLTQGIIWSLTEGEDAASATEAPPAQPEAESQPLVLRDISKLLDAAPVLLPHQRVLAEWLADYYCSSLPTAVLLMLPPRLEGGMRLVLGQGAQDRAEDAEGAAGSNHLAGEVSRALADFVREKGAVDEAKVREMLGAARAGTAIAELLQHQVVDLVPAHLRTQRARVVRLATSYDEAARWREETQQQLDTLSAAKVLSVRKQLAVISLLLATSPRTPTPGAPAKHWTLTEVRKATKATPPTFDALQRLGLLAIEDAEVARNPLEERPAASSAPLRMTPAQRQAVERIVAAKDAPVFLLHGVTGSGKTEVYLQALAAVIERGQRGIVLVPEIALTPQAMARFAGRFPGRVAVLHSGLTHNERYDQWRRIRAGQIDVVVGSRSAIFAPLANLGLIVIDEEHESAYKQEDRIPTYHARDVALALGRLTGAAVVLGSATPSSESYYAAQSGRYALLELPTRVAQAAEPLAPEAASESTAGPASSNGTEQGLANGHASLTPSGLPTVTIVDLRAELRAGHTNVLSRALVGALSEVLASGQQAILFLNRRGMASYVLCRECGYVACCPRCDIPLTYHAAEHAMLCHYCFRQEAPPAVCPVCLSGNIRYYGHGTERVEDVVGRLFPSARLLRWDNDTARGRHGHERLLDAFANHQADILIGTQMIAKGLDFPAVTLVGVISADTALYLPDYRSAERAFQLLTQVAGRAGRGSTPGRVIFQTFTPEHFCIQAAAEQNYREFYEAEISARRQYGYPPFRRFVTFTYRHEDRYTCQVEAIALFNTLTQLVATLGLPNTDLVGPAPAFLERLREQYRWQIIVRGPDLRPLLREVAPEELPRGWSVNIDPMSTL